MPSGVGGGMLVLLLPHANPILVEAVAHDGEHADQIGRGAEAARGEVALQGGRN